MEKKFIVDISTFQRNIDYAKLAKAVDGVIIRCGYRGWGSSGTLKEDEYFKTHISNCIKHGIPVGVYWFAQEVTKAEGIEAANFVYKLIKGYKLGLPVYYDSEGSTAPNGTGRADKISKSVRTEATVGFCEQIKKLGYTPGVYASESWFNTHLNFSKIKGYSIWVAKYGSNTGKAGTKPSTSVYDIWQYSSKGKVDGYNGNIDVNYCYKDFSSKTPAKPTTSTTTKKSIEKIAEEVLEGKWGNGDVRKKKLKAAGYNPEEVQKKVNELIEKRKKNLYKKGSKIVLRDVALYPNAVAIKSTKTISGTYYIYDGKKFGNRYRITNSSSRVGKAPASQNVTGYIKKSDIK